MTTAYVEAFGDLAVLPLGAEAAAVAHASVARRREFATARHCARAALRRLDLPGAAVPADGDGVPMWPDGVVGSITHCAGYRAAIVVRAGGHRQATGVGLDAEPHRALPAGVLELVAGNDERRALEQLADECAEVHWDRLLFCVKEAAFKATFPRSRRWLEFDEVTAELDPDGLFRARPGTGAAVVGGRWWVRRGLVLACGVSSS